MRIFSGKLVFGAPLLGAILGAYACGSNDYDSCEASRSCSPKVADGGEGGEPSVETSGSGGSGGEGGEAGSSAGGAPGGGEPEDTTRPTVLSITPENDSTGVTSDTPIVITFSEPMDRELVEAGFSCPALTGDLTFEWNDDGTVLTVTQEGGLEYAEGEDETIAPKAYTVIVQPTVADLAGNSLQQAASSSFETLRRVRMTLPHGSIEDSVREDGEIYIELRAGDGLHNWAYRGFVGFVTASIPDDREIETASIELLPKEIEGELADLGELRIDHIHTEALVPELYDSSPLEAEIATVTDPVMVDVWLSVDVTAALADDYLNRGAREARSHFRIYFASESDFDGSADLVDFAHDTYPVDERPRMVVTYLIE